MKENLDIACNNEKCVDRESCKNYIMWAKYNNTKVKKGGGDEGKHCKRYLPYKEEL